MDEAERWARIRRSRRDPDPTGDRVDLAVARMRERLGNADARSVRDIEEIRLLAIEAVEPGAAVSLAADVNVIRSGTPDHREAATPDDPRVQPTDRSKTITILGVLAIVAGFAAPVMLASTRRRPGTFFLNSPSISNPFFGAEPAILLAGTLAAVSALLFLMLALGRTKTPLFNDTSPPAGLYLFLGIWWLIGIAGSLWRASGADLLGQPVAVVSLLAQAAAIATVAFLWRRTRRLSRAAASTREGTSAGGPDLSAIEASRRRLATERRQIREAFSAEQRAAALGAEIEGIRWWHTGGALSDEAARASLASAFDRWSPERP